MKERKVIAASLRDAPSIHPLSGQTSLNAERMDGLEMFTGRENGFLTVLWQNLESGVPLSNVKSLVWEKTEKQ